jgi:hypothetical protein
MIMEWNKKRRIIWGVYFAGAAVAIGGNLLTEAFPVAGPVVWAVGMAIILGVAVCCTIDRNK